MNPYFSLPKFLSFILLFLGTSLIGFQTAYSQTNCEIAPCAASVLGNGPDPCNAKVYCSNSGEVLNGLIACTNAADTDGCGVDASIDALPVAGGVVDNFLDEKLPNNCYSTGDRVQWIKFWLPAGVNSVKIQGSGQLDAWAVFHVSGDHFDQSSLLDTPCDIPGDVNFLVACSNMNQYQVITNENSDPNFENLYLIALIYEAPTNGTINFKTKECEALCFPSIECPPPATFECSDQTGIDNWLNSYVAEDCGNNSFVENNYSAALFTGCNGTGTAEIIFELKKNNAQVYDDCSTTITLVDTTDPMISCPSPGQEIFVDADANCEFSYTVDATATDNCDDQVDVSSMDGMPEYAANCAADGYLYRVKRTWTATDDCGNSSSCYKYINVRDVTIPAISCPSPGAPIYVQADANCNFTYTEDATATDNCDMDVTVTSNDVEIVDNPDCSYDYIKRVKRMWTATDDCGNTNSCYKYIYVQDVTPPMISCPSPGANIYVDADADCDFTYNGMASATDNCDDNVSISSSDSPPEYAADCVGAGYLYRVMRTWTAMDDCGNTDQCSRYIYVQDVTPPSGTCPSIDQNVGCVDDIPCTINDVPQSLIDQIAGAFSDNCGNVNVTISSLSDLTACTQNSSGGYSVSRTVYFEVSDDCGNTVPTLCPVTYSAPCFNFCTYTQGYYGNPGGNNSHLELISGLMYNYGDIVIGRPGRSLTIQDPQCVIDFLPGGSLSKPLKPGDPIANTGNGCDLGDNPTQDGRLRNNLASNTIALQLNLWHNQGLAGYDLTTGCIPMPAIPGYNPATVGELFDLANDYLGGLLGNSGNLGGSLTNAITTINEYWNECNTYDPCNGGSGAGSYSGDYEDASYLLTEKSIQLVPNPAVNFLNINLEGYDDQRINLMVYNNMGMRMVQQEVDYSAGNPIRLDLASFSQGLYFVQLEAGGEVEIVKFMVIGK